MTQRPLKPGETFDRYVIERWLGEGGMGNVYSALDTRLQRKVALKFLHTEKGSGLRDSSREATDRLLREARAAAALEHPNAVAVYDVGEVGGTPYLAMELVEGRSMRDIIVDPGVLWSTRLAWMVDVARALGAAHERGLVHRDVKPENIMVRPDGVVKVLDFGIARRLRAPLDVPMGAAPATGGSVRNERPGLATLSGKGDLLGTPYYMAPEQLRGAAVDARADQFAWGVVTYEVVTGVLPWKTGDDPLQVVAEIFSATPEPIGARIPDFPALVEATLFKTLAKVPAHRFGSMAEVVAALEPYREYATRDVPNLIQPPPSQPSAQRLSSQRSAPTVASEPFPQPPPVPTISTKSGLASRTSIPPASARLGGRPWVMRAAIAILLLVVAGVTSLALRARRPPAPVDAVAVAPPPGPTSVADLPAPSSTVPGAALAYQAALLAYRDGNVPGLRRGLAHAIELDPELSPAYLRVAIAMFWNGAAYEARENFQKASVRRASLNAHDQVLLDAMEPMIGRDPPVPLELQQRLAEATKRYPLDAEMALYYANALLERGEMKPAADALARAGTLDPKWSVVWILLGQTRAYLGDFEGAFRAWEQCAGIPQAVSVCSSNRARLYAQLGDCSRMEAEARRMTAKDPDSPQGYDLLARALASLGRPSAAVAEALRQKWARLVASARPAAQLADEIDLALMTGDFAAAERKAKQLDGLVAGNPDPEAHAKPARRSLEVRLESGRVDEAVPIARDYLTRRDAWTAFAHRDDQSLQSELTVPMLAALLRARKLTQAEFDERRAAWVHEWTSATAPFYARYAWFQAYATVAETSGDAKAALAALPEFEPLPTFSFQGMITALAGHVQLLAKNLDAASDLLERGASACTALDEPVLYVHARYDLAAAREARGGKDAACDGYREVVARWGSATPHAVTADRAKARMRALRCLP